MTKATFLGFSGTGSPVFLVTGDHGARQVVAPTPTLACEKYDAPLFEVIAEGTVTV